MNKEETIHELCEIASIVGATAFDHQEAHDCFCGRNPHGEQYFQFSEKVIAFIREAVNEKCEKEAGK